MKKYLAGTLLAIAGILTTGCSLGDKPSKEVAADADELYVSQYPTPDTVVASATIPGKEYIVAMQRDSARIYREHVASDKAFIVISKGEYRLYVYDIVGADTVLAASFPVCYALNTEQKTRDGDNCTPEGDMSHPFTISEIKDASGWVFNFDDGRGDILAFGHWFMRLDLSTGPFADNPGVAANHSIGIHGSTGNEMSVPGRDSHGCVRMRDADLVTLHDAYAHVGMRVVVRPYKENKYGFERRAEKRLGDKYKKPWKGLAIEEETKVTIPVAAAEDNVLSEEISSRKND